MRLFILAAAAASSLLLTGCGESPLTVEQLGQMKMVDQAPARSLVEFTQDGMHTPQFAIVCGHDKATGHLFMSFVGTFSGGNSCGAWAAETFTDAWIKNRGMKVIRITTPNDSKYQANLQHAAFAYAGLDRWEKDQAVQSK